MKSGILKIEHIILCFVLFFTMALASTSLAATYYVDNASGNDSNPGTQAKPWKRCPGMAGWNGAAKLKAGDTVFFKNTGVWTGGGGNSLLDVVGGVVYNGDTWGNGLRATFRATGSFKRSIIYIQKDDGVYETTVQGFNIDGNRQHASGINMNWPSSSNLTGKTKRIQNCTIHDFVQNGSRVVYGIKVGAVNSTQVRNVEILDNIVYNTPRTGVNIYPAIGSSSCRIYNTVVRGNEIYNTGGVGTGHGLMLKNYSINTVVEFNYIHNTKSHGISLENDGAPGPENALIRYNIVESCGKGGISFMNSGNKSACVYGNLIYRNKRAGIIFQSVSGANISARFFNNVLHENSSAYDNAEVLISPANYKTLEFRNNVISPRNGKSAISGENRISAQSSNLKGNVQFKDAKNLPKGFKGTYGIDMEPNTDGLSVVSHNAIDSGAKLGSPYDGAINLSGCNEKMTRESQGSGWDIGAYETVVKPPAFKLQPPVIRIVQ